MLESERQRARMLTLTALTALTLYLCFAMLRPFLDVIVWGTVLVIVFQPVYQWLLRRTGHPSGAAALAIVLIFVAVVVPLGLVGWAVVHELTQLGGQVQETVQATLADPVKGERIQRLMDWVRARVDVDQAFSADDVKQIAGRASSVVMKSTVSFVGGALGTVVALFFTTFTMFYLFRDGPAFLRRVEHVLPLDPDQSQGLLRRTAEIINASVYGVLVIALLQGVLAGLMFWAVGIPSSLVWGTLMTLLSTIPMLGSFIVWVPAAALLALTGHWVKALILTAWCGGVVGLVDNFLRPRLVGQRTKMHELLIFFAVLGGLQLFGLVGLLLGPVVFAVAISLFDVFSLKRIEEIEVVQGAAQPRLASAAASPIHLSTQQSDGGTAPRAQGQREQDDTSRRKIDDPGSSAQSGSGSS